MSDFRVGPPYGDEKPREVDEKQLKKEFDKTMSELESKKEEPTDKKINRLLAENDERVDHWHEIMPVTQKALLEQLSESNDSESQQLRKAIRRGEYKRKKDNC